MYDENIRITCGLIDEMKARASQGLVLANDVTRYELNLSNLKYDRLAVVNSISNLNYSLVSYLQMNDTDTIVPAIDFDRINFRQCLFRNGENLVVPSRPYSNIMNSNGTC